MQVSSISIYRSNSNYLQRQNNKLYVNNPDFRGGFSLYNLNPVNYQAKKLFVRSQEASRHRIQEVIPQLQPYTKEVKVGKSYAWDINPNDRKKYLVVLHGASQNISNLQTLYKSVAENTEYAILAPEYSSCGKNPKCDLTEQILTDDINNAIKYLEAKNIKTSDVSVLGHSFGSFLAAKATKEHPDLEKLILVAPVASFDPQIINFRALSKNKLPNFVKFLLVNCKILRRSLRKVLNTEKYVRETDIPVDIIHSKYDNVINVESAFKLSDMCKKLDIMHILPNSNHIMDKAKINAVVVALNKKKL